MNRILVVVLIAGAGLWASLPVACFAQIPPAPPLAELGDALRNELLTNLNSENYHKRDSAQKTLTSASVETVTAIQNFFKTATYEGKVRGFQVAQQISLKLHRLQMDDQALQVSEMLDELRLQENHLLGHRLDEFRAIHSALFERSASRALTRLNAVIEYEPMQRVYPGISESVFIEEVPRNIFLGDNWLGSKTDFRHLEIIFRNQMGGIKPRIVYHIKGCPIPYKELQNLAAGLTRVAVDQRSRARLGIGTTISFDAQTWKISQVQPGSPAALAGIRLGDLVVRNQSEMVNSFADLVESLHKNEPGDRIDLDILTETTVSKKLEMIVPENPKDLGIEIDEEFRQFILVKSIAKGSVAEKAGLTNMHCIHKINGRPIFSAFRFSRELPRLTPGDKLTFTVQPLKTVTVRLRGWVGPYR